MQDRRKAFFLIVTVLTVSCAFSVPTQVDSNNRSSLKSAGSSTDNHSQVLIIGAGVSGITAAARLMEHGVHDVNILEAENRIGGRVHSVPFGDNVVDLGAQWVHGCKGNVIYDIAKPLGLLDEGSPSALDHSLFFGANGTKVNAELMHHFMNLSCAVVHQHDALSNYSGSLGQFFHERFTRWSSIPKSNITADPSMIPSFVSWIEKILAYENGADSWFNISAKGLEQFWEILGHQTITFKKHGLSSIIDLLTRRYPNPDQELPVRNKSHLRTQAKSINWGPRGVLGPNGKKAVLVETSNGAKYTADFVIVTVSLGVLKKAAIMFNPPITGTKLNTIKHLGFGEVEQLFFHFNETWWPTTVTGLSVLSTDQDRQRFNRLHTTLSEKGEWANALTGFYVLSGQPRSVLFNWLTGESARNLGKYSDQEIMTGVLSWFEMYSNQKLPSPVSFVRSKWSSNPHFCGSFSYRSVNSEKYDAWPSHLAEPLMGKDSSPEVLFAGEATSNHHYSTVHGAMETGRREADRILDFLRKSKTLRKASNKI